jgi:hypothetical protein
MMKKNIQQRTSNNEHPIKPERVSVGRWMLDVGCWMFPLAIFSALPLRAQTNASGINALPTLVPPYAELPPALWEQHATSMVIAGLGIIALAAFVLWLVFRPRPKIIIPPEVQARQALEALRQEPEDGAALSRISQVTRHYFIAAFQLAPGELTTAEFNRELVRCHKINPELVLAAVNFLRNCDAHKFSTAAAPAKLGAANRALNLVEQAEQRRVQLRQLAETQTQGPRA